MPLLNQTKSSLMIMQTAELKIDDCWNRIGIWRSGKEKCPELDIVIHCRNCPVFSRTGRKLLRTPPPEGYRSECTKVLATKKEIKSLNVKTAFVFRTGNDWLALPSHMIREVVNMGQIHSLPNITSNSSARSCQYSRPITDMCIHRQGFGY